MFRTPVVVAKTPALGAYTPTSDAEASRRLSSAFDRAIADGSDRTMAALNDAAVDFVDRLREGGMTPERVIIALKTALRTGHRTECSWFPSLDVTSDWASARAESTMYARLFSWCVEAYYDEMPFTSRRRRDRRDSRDNRSVSITAWSAAH